MNPNRRVGVMPKNEREVGDRHQDMEAGEQARDDVPPPAMYNSFTMQRIHLTFNRKINLLKINGILAAIYLCLGLTLMLISFGFHPDNRLKSGNVTCYAGYCFARNLNRPVYWPAHHHHNTDAYHPYNWGSAMVGFILTVYGCLVLTKITMLAINTGNIVNWIVAGFCLFGITIGFLHVDRKPFHSFTPIYWSEGVSHTFFEPLFLLIAWVLTTGQAILNFPYVEFRSPIYYSEFVRNARLQESLTEDIAD